MALVIRIPILLKPQLVDVRSEKGIYKALGGYGTKPYYERLNDGCFLVFNNLRQENYHGTDYVNAKASQERQLKGVFDGYVREVALLFGGYTDGKPVSLSKGYIEDFAGRYRMNSTKIVKTYK